MNLSEHMTLAEFENSPTAAKRGISNKMNAGQIEAARLLCQKVFEPVRKFVGGPIKLNSGFRSVILNRAIGGSSSSQHCKGEAIDIPINSKAFHYIKDNLDFDQLIWEFGNTQEPAWVHVSYKKSGNRKQILRAVKVAGKTAYKPFS